MVIGGKKNGRPNLRDTNDIVISIYFRPSINAIFGPVGNDFIIATFDSANLIFDTAKSLRYSRISAFKLDPELSTSLAVNNAREDEQLSLRANKYLIAIPSVS